MGCKSCGQKNSKPNLPVSKATSGSWKLLNADGSLFEWHSSRVAAQSSNLRKLGGKGTVERA